MPSNESNKDGDQGTQDDSKSDKPAVSDEDVRQEAGKAADASLAAQKKAKELQDAAAAAGDPEERQRLTEEATNAHIEAESFGKTAKYLRSGTFQGMAMGTGLGVAPGASLGAITGTLVGGVSSTILGGLGAGIGAATGALHGPFLNIGKVAGKGMKKLTSFLPEWAVSEEQKRTLEKMVDQVNKQEMPGAEELEKFKSEGGGKLDEGWMKTVKGMMPDQKEISDAAKAGAQAGGGEADSKTDEAQSDQQSNGSTAQKSNNQGRKKPRKLNAKPSNSDQATKEIAGDGEAAGDSTKDNRGDDSKKNEELDRKKADLDRREAELDEREKALAEREESLRAKSDGDATTTKPKGQPRKLQSRS
ncbi:hypothetical protein PtrSN002B_011190 [Pyrenophora tritici-repentis]|uniref:Gly-zipper-Omp multi-domain protein n=2 Tax=Pyrenophora tritici-repentis TaxID=45151 RepID=A0A2W1G1G1_9PLEO|nr:uncharacterized protein PTRG_01273 [Pyrenophora tritici-repentis Pt-1C-BFP]KAA8625916.1 hypothetical protein PtrV1_01596 [Pyrenophora tritici-repentis]EDU40711.1 conserved hypothetical protein [Pyrenophora tritici-repentis Pt-1C-BFP]KAF7454330.1 hypothetical protein A1F99_015880 [Pyrenophora tritici-repentis]KAF7577439.1 Gly-zipper-Omp multi-domain protein [Pyrenophora tritici-repentis]KAG9388078.1 hypothetical protein A1F94_000970 [Pyrenophora tritici-repentis]